MQVKRILSAEIKINRSSWKKIIAYLLLIGQEPHRKRRLQQKNLLPQERVFPSVA
jgi:hypothetical protein